MKSTIVIYGSSTGTCQSIAQTIASMLDAQAVDVASIDEATITSYDNLILGTSTWGAGEMQDDWYDGDSESYPDTFCGGMKELYDAVVVAGGNVLPGVSTEGYTFDDSEAVENGKFVGLVLDEINEDDKTEERINAWLESIKPSL